MVGRYTVPLRKYSWQFMKASQNSVTMSVTPRLVHALLPLRWRLVGLPSPEAIPDFAFASSGLHWLNGRFPLSRPCPDRHRRGRGGVAPRPHQHDARRLRQYLAEAD